MSTADMDNKYYGHFKAVMGRGDGSYYANMGHVYKTRPGVQRGYGSYIVSPKLSSRQRGLGFGSTLMSMFKMAAPILKALGSKAINVVSNVAQDAIQGSNIKDSAIKHARSEVSDIIAQAPAVFSGLVTKASEAMTEPTSQPLTTSESTSARRGVKRKNKNKKTTVPTKRQRGGGQYSAGLALLQ
jgi:hypothetical protein